ncbi:MAG: methyltransferase family protein [Candidatus Thorarchaeota archaeon]
MSFWFIISVAGAILLLPLHFLSVEHHKLDSKYGEEKGKKIGSLLGVVSGWGYFLFLFGIWLSPQEKFAFPVEGAIIIEIPGLLLVSILDLILGICLILPGMYFGIKGVTDLGLKVSETHRPETLVTTGVYQRLRHPQYFGAFLSHLAITLLLSAFYSLLVTPIILMRDYAASRKEEKELLRAFGEEYAKYKEGVPMFFPRFRD